MLFVDNKGITDPRVNLAFEEYLLRHVDETEPLLLFYINEPSVIIGRNQNTLEEINVDYVDAHGIHVVRRLSGGGAVYHDLGNLNFSFITRNSKENLLNFRKFTAPVIQVLNHMGVPAELSGRNDIVVDGRKISGNASYASGPDIVSHGTLLFDSDLSHLTDALKPRASKIESKGIKSIRSRVANIKEYLPDSMDILTFRRRLLEGIFAGEPAIPEYELTSQDWQAVDSLFEERYSTWEWNYGHSPDFNIRKTQRFPTGEIDALIRVQNGKIDNIRFYGDFFGVHAVAELEQRLAGVRYTPESLDQVLRDLDLGGYFAGVYPDEFIHFLYG